jgi:hypothetical protein
MQATGSKIVLLTMVGVTHSLAWNAAKAAPPGASQQPAQSHPTLAQNISQNLSSISARLDLRAPARLALDEQKPAAFPSAIIHRQFGATEQTTQLPALGASNARIRPPIEELARHIQHEGLPIARLWENQSALVHLGLNQRGKPGLWLVQKVH